MVHPGIWSSIEQSLGIICACLTTLRPLISLILPTSTSSFRNTRASFIKVKYDSKSKFNRNLISLSALHSKTTDLAKKGRGQQPSPPSREIPDSVAGGFQRSNDEEHMFSPLYERYIRTDAGQTLDPDLEALGADSRSVIVKKQPIEQYSSGSASTTEDRNASAT